MLARVRRRAGFAMPVFVPAVMHRDASAQELSKRWMTTPLLRFAQFLRIARFNASETTIAQLRTTHLETCGKRACAERICIVDGGNIQQKAFQRRICSIRLRLF